MAIINGSGFGDWLFDWSTDKSSVLNANWSLGGDHMFGGVGNDTYHVNSADDRVHELRGEGIDTVRVAMSPGTRFQMYTPDYMLPLNVENLEVIVRADPSPQWSPWFAGNELDNKITGSAARELVDGEAGDDILRGLGGSDRLRGGTGNDALYGGIGSDALLGQDGEDLLVGGPGSDMLLGNKGSDEMWGGEGADSFMVSGSGVDQIKDYVDGQEHILISILLVSPGGIAEG